MNIKIPTMQEELPTLQARISRDNRLECFNLIDSFEPEIRRFIETKLKALYGAEWWEKGVDENIRGKAEGLRVKEAARGIKVELIDCLEMDHYRLILTDSHNWKGAFQATFRDNTALLARLTILKECRNPVAHSRVLRYEDKLGVISAIQWLKNKMSGENM